MQVTDLSQAKVDVATYQDHCQATKQVVQMIQDQKADNSTLITLDEIKHMNLNEAQEIAKTHNFVISQLNLMGMEEERESLCRDGILLVPRNQVPTYKTLDDFIQLFNRSFRNREQLRSHAHHLLREIRNNIWVHEKGVKRIPKESEVSSTRKAYLKMYGCEDASIKELSLSFLIEILECDPLHMETAYDLIELQTKLNDEIQTIKTQNLNTRLQQLLMKAYAISLECILYHAASGHLNGVTDTIKDTIWSGAEGLAEYNILEDEEIKFWSDYATQAAQRIRTNITHFRGVLRRLGYVARAGIQFINIPLNQDDLTGMTTGALSDLHDSVHHIETHECWFEELLVIKKLCRYAIYDKDAFHKIAENLKERRLESINPVLLYGFVTILEYVAIESPVEAIQEESIKLLTQYAGIDKREIQDRVTLAFSEMCKTGMQKLRQTAYVVLQLLKTTGLNLSHLPRCNKEIISYDQVHLHAIKFVLRRLADIRDEDMGGQSAVTLLIHGTNEKVIPCLIKCLKDLCPEFNHPNRRGNTPYHLLIKEKNIDLLRSIHPFLDCDINHQNNHMQTALHLAVESFDSNRVQTLLELGANPNLCNEDRKTPLMIAIENNRLQIVKLLYKYQGTTPPFTPISYAARNGADSSLIYLIRNRKTEITQTEAWYIHKHLKKCSKQFRIYHRNLIRRSPLYAKMFKKRPRPPKNRFVDTPLHIALRKWNNENIFEEYYEHIDFFWNVNHRGELPIDCAIKAQPVYVFEYLWWHITDDQMIDLHHQLIENTQGRLSLGHILAEIGSLDLFKRLVRLDPSIATLKNTTPYQHTPLHLSVKKHRTDFLHFYFEEGLPVDATDAFGNNILHIAGIHGNPMTSHELGIGCHHDFEHLARAKNHDGNTPLHLAVEKKHFDCVLNFLKVKGLVHVKNGQGDAPIHTAAKAGCIVSIRSILHYTRGKQLTYCNDNGNSILHLASFHGNIGLVKVLLQQGADIERKNVYGETPLMLAVQSGKRLVVEYLLAMKADPNSKDDEGETVLHKAIFHRQQEIVKMLLDLDKKSNLPEKRRLIHQIDLQNESAIHELAKKHTHLASEVGRQIFILFYMVENGADLNQKNEKGETLLHHICENGCIELLDVLIEISSDGLFATGAKFSVRDNQGNTPLFKACENNKPKIVGKILKRRNRGNRSNNEGLTPLLIGANRGHTEVVRLLIKAGVSLTARDKNGQNILHHLLQNKIMNEGLISLIGQITRLEPKLIREKDHFGNTPLHILADHNHFEAVETLLFHLEGHGKRKFIWQKNLEKKAAYDIAVEKKHHLTAQQIRSWQINEDHL